MDRRSNRGSRRSDVRGCGRSRAGHRGLRRGHPPTRRRIVRAGKRRVPRTGLAAPRARTGLAVVQDRFAGREPGVARRGNVLRGAGCDLAPPVAGRAARRRSGRGLVAKDGSLEHLDISVSELERSGAFWAAFLKDLGYREFAKSATAWSWTNDESTVFLLQAESQYLDPPYHRKRVGLNHLAFSVSDPKQVDAMATQLKERNIPLLYGGPRTGRTTYAVFFEDPDRIKIEVVAPLVAREVPSPYAGQLPSPARGGGQGGGAITATEVITYAGAVVTLGGRGTLRAGLLAAALSVSLLLAAIMSVLRLQLEHGWAVEVVFLVTGAILVAAAEYGRRQNVLWATEVLAFAGPSMAIITAFITAQDGNLPLEIFGGVLAGVAFAVSAYRGSAGYAFAGGVRLFAFVPDIEFRYFQSSLGFAVSLVISGLVLLGIALLLARLLPRLRR